MLARNRQAAHQPQAAAPGPTSRRDREFGEICPAEDDPDVDLDDEHDHAARHRAAPANDHHYPARPCPLEHEPASTLYEEYHPFGTSSYAANDSGIEVSAKRYRFIGKERDEETGLYHLGARYYASWLVRWCAPDPIGLTDGPNRFAYARANPVGVRDPTGRAGQSALTQELVEQQITALNAAAEAAIRGGDERESLEDVANLTAQLRHETASLKRERVGAHFPRRAATPRGDRVVLLRGNDTRPSMSTGAPDDALTRRFDPAELQRAEFAQFSNLTWVGSANRSAQVASHFLESAGAIEPKTNIERRRMGVVVGEAFGAALSFGTARATGRGKEQARRESAASQADEAAEPRVRSQSGTIFTHEDRHVGELATRIEAEFPGSVKGNPGVPQVKGSPDPEVDILLQPGLPEINVKGGRARNLGAQMSKHESYYGRAQLGYGPGASNKQIRGFQDAWNLATNKIEQVIEWVRRWQ